MRILLVLLVIAWLPSVASASPIWGKNCSHTQADSVSAPSNPVSIIGAGEHAGGLSRRACLGWGTNALSQAGNDESRTLTVRADSVLFCLISTIGAEGAATATAMIKKCPGAPEIAVSDNTCIDMLDTSLTGAEGGDATQNACVRAGPGVYKVETAAGGAGEFPFLTADAEE